MARLVLMCGLPGSGKTTRARELERLLPALRLAPDEWLRELGLDGYDEEARARVERLQRRVAERVLALGRHVILENGFWSRCERDELRAWARSGGHTVELCLLNPPLDTLRERLWVRNRRLPAGAFPVREDDLVGWANMFEVPSPEELDLFDAPRDPHSGP